MRSWVHEAIAPLGMILDLLDLLDTATKAFTTFLSNNYHSPQIRPGSNAINPSELLLILMTDCAVKNAGACWERFYCQVQDRATC